jgi:glycosyltransferase involved in cell wall biosynthesis
VNRAVTSGARASRAVDVIVPAHNEEAVIGRTLAALLDGALPGEFDVLVVCNGCADRTADRVRSEFPEARVLELSQASKTAAINAGLRATGAAEVLLLDADVELPAASARALIAALRSQDGDAAIGCMDIDDSSSSPVVRGFYRIWKEHPYLSRGKFAAAIAMSREVVDRIGELPAIVADDSYLWRTIPEDRTVVVDSVRFRVRVPRTLGSLVRVRSRIHRGNRQLDRLVERRDQEQAAPKLDFLRRVLAKPSLWYAFGCFVMVGCVARARSRLAGPVWERDTDSRQNATA